MKKVLLTLVLVVVCLTSPHASSKLIEGIQVLYADNSARCTVFSINEAERLWGTARHCIKSGAIYTINNGYAVLVYAAPGNDDVAVFKGRYAGKAFKLAKEAPKVGDVVSVMGHPYGYPFLVKTEGIMAARGVPISDSRPVSDILDITVAGGNSGSPVLQDGKVVGILWGGFTNSNHSLSIPHETVKRLIGHYFGS